MGEASQAAAVALGEREELRRHIERLEADLSRFREKEQLLVSTLISATSHATAIREGARREAELILRKARAEAEKRITAVERARKDAERDLLRLRRVTEEMRRGLSGVLTATLEELHVETEREIAPSEQPMAELEAALDSVVGARLEAGPFQPQREASTPDDERRSSGGPAHGFPPR